jgi:hypothetical protein
MKVLPTMGSMYSGSMRGITASHNKGGLYFRGRTVPTNPNTARQQLVRSVVGGLMQMWSMVLTESERQAWRDYAANVPVVDSLGQTMQLSGVNWFVKVLSLALQISEGPLTTPTGLPTVAVQPTLFNTGEGVVEVTRFEGDFTTGAGTLDVDANLAGETTANGVAVLFIGAPQTPGTRFYKGPYQLAAVQAVSSPAGSFELVADLGDPLEWASDSVPVVGWDGLYVPLKLVMLYADGRRSQEWRSLVEFVDATP